MCAQAQALLRSPCLVLIPLHMRACNSAREATDSFRCQASGALARPCVGHSSPRPFNLKRKHLPTRSLKLKSQLQATRCSTPLPKTTNTPRTRKPLVRETSRRHVRVPGGWSLPLRTTTCTPARRARATKAASAMKAAPDPSAGFARRVSYTLLLLLG